MRDKELQIGHSSDVLVVNIPTQLSDCCLLSTHGECLSVRTTSKSRTGGCIKFNAVEIFAMSRSEILFIFIYRSAVRPAAEYFVNLSSNEGFHLTKCNIC